MKNSFVLYTKYRKQVSMLDDAQAGTLLKAILAHECREELPEMDGVTEMLFSIIAEQLEFDADKYEESCQRSVANGKKGGRPKKAGENAETQESQKKGLGFSENPKKPLGFSENPEKANGYFENPEKHDTDTDTDTDTDKTLKESRANLKRFAAPSIDEVREYCKERGNKVDAETFIDFYASKGWKVGSQPMKDWRAAVRTWEKRDSKPRPQTSPPGKVREYNRFEQRTYDYDDLKNKLLARNRA